MPGGGWGKGVVMGPGEALEVVLRFWFVGDHTNRLRLWLLVPSLIDDTMSGLEVC